MLEPAMTDPVLELHDLRRVFPGFELGPLSLRLEPGHVYGLLGPNGAGKTTLLDLITLQRRPTTGTLCRGGGPIHWGDATWKERFSYIRETPAFYDDLTVTETLALAGQLHERWDAALAETLVGTFGLHPGQRVRHLSKGTKVKLGVVTGLAHRADLLILDEPTAGLDPTARLDLQHTLRDLIREHPALCVVLSSHIFEDIEATATELLILRGGKLVFETSTDRVHDSVLYRSTAPGTVAASPDLVLRWRRHGTERLLVRRGSRLDADLRLRPDHHEEHPPSLVAAVYHATDHLDAH